jgi:hypothetical protein
MGNANLINGEMEEEEVCDWRPTPGPMRVMLGWNDSFNRAIYSMSNINVDSFPLESESYLLVNAETQ